MVFIPRFPANCICLLLLAAPTLGQGTEAHNGTLTCNGTDSQTIATSDIDYPAINQLLVSAGDQQRLLSLPVEIKKLEISKAPEATLVRQRLQLALAQTYSALNMTGPAMLTLKSLPVSSPQAPEALLLLAELEVRNGRPKAAVRWLRQMAELFPEETLTIRGLWRAAELNHPHSRQALALWQQAAEQADEALNSAQHWHARSLQPDFLDKVNSEKLSPELWRLSRSVFTDPAFASADALQAEVRYELQCLTANQGAQLRRMGKNPKLLADLNDTVETLAQQLDAARNELSTQEKLSSELAQRLSDCNGRKLNCDEFANQQSSCDKQIIRLKERIQTLDKKLAFLREEGKALGGYGQDVIDRGDTASKLSSRLNNTKAFMRDLLQKRLADAVADWEALSAEAHYRLAVAQQPRIQPGLAPPK